MFRARRLKKVHPGDTLHSLTFTPLPVRDIEVASYDRRYSAVWLHVELCPRDIFRCKEGHWSLKVVTQGQETLYRVAGHQTNYSLQIINGIAPDMLEGGLLLPVGAVDADGLRTMLASVTVDNVNLGWNSQQWVYEVLDELLHKVDRSPNDVSLLEFLAAKAWNFAGEV